MQAVHDIRPKQYWPLPVREQFPEMMALFLYDREEQAQKYHEEQYVAAVEDVANGSTVNTVSKSLQAYYRAQYQKFVRHITNAYLATPGFPQARNPYIFYYRAHLDDAHEPYFDVDNTRTSDIDYEDELYSNINYEDQLFLPVEPIFKQFSIDLDLNIDNGAFYLPLDTW
ncbi:uncharacterized protein M421DRAFT_6514 [Didymella exigua CBS 183.55]|uniref:Uncharacterized protein n=1 Tax=Didymella exigua CBS 183.55 TaxID=1150837 RepID=A0A6A5RF74_9PLEO|nr:uncharacterized protein M421DRAFT_6514 [Didymella exigua CBS 183.55]KAF1926951.1 hypothetical protein M421DRAFT_6514 [Didymella exigua CBS 183.55]